MCCRPSRLMSRVIFEKKFEAYRRERAEWIRQRPERQRKREEVLNTRGRSDTQPP